MDIPKKITPDRVKDAIVELRYNSKLPHEVVIGYVFEALDESYNYVPRRSGNSLSMANPFGNPMIFDFREQPFIYNDNIQIQIQPNAFIFSSKKSNEYIGWSVFEPEIMKVLAQLSKTDFIEKFNRVGIRYISEYPNTELGDCVDFSFSFGLPEIKSKSYSFRSQFEYDQFRVNLSLRNNIELQQNQNESNFSKVSQVDIDVIADLDFDMSNLIGLNDVINKAHNAEKSIFFGLLKKEFLNTLKVEY